MKKSFLLLLSCGALLISCGRGGASSDSSSSSIAEPSVDSSLASSDSSSGNPVYVDPDASSKKAEIREWMTSFKEFEGNVAVASIHGYVKCSIDIEWISATSLVGKTMSINGICFAAVYASNAWPASWVRTSTSALVPLKFEKINGALNVFKNVQ